MRRILYLLILNSFVLKDKSSKILKYISKKAFGLALSFETAVVSDGKAILHNVKVCDQGLLLQAEEVVITLALSWKFIKLIEVKRGTVFLDLIKGNKMHVNWAKPFITDPDSFEPFTFVVPNIGNVVVEDSELIFSYLDKGLAEKKVKSFVKRHAYLKSAKVIFNRESIEIEAEGYKKEEKYDFSMFISNNNTFLNLKLNNIEIDSDVPVFFSASKQLFLKKGIGSINLLIDINSKEINGEAVAKDLFLTLKALPSNISVPEVYIEFLGDRVISQFNAIALNSDFDVSLNYNSIDKTLDIGVKGDTSIDLLNQKLAFLKKLDLPLTGEAKDIIFNFHLEKGKSYISSTANVKPYFYLDWFSFNLAFNFVIKDEKLLSGSFSGFRESEFFNGTLKKERVKMNLDIPKELVALVLPIDFDIKGRGNILIEEGKMSGSFDLFWKSLGLNSEKVDFDFNIERKKSLSFAFRNEDFSFFSNFSNGFADIKLDATNLKIDHEKLFLICKGKFNWNMNQILNADISYSVEQLRIGNFRFKPLYIQGQVEKNKLSLALDLEAKNPIMKSYFKMDVISIEGVLDMYSKTFSIYSKMDKLKFRFRDIINEEHRNIVINASLDDKLKISKISTDKLRIEGTLGEEVDLKFDLSSLKLFNSILLSDLSFFVKKAEDILEIKLSSGEVSREHITIPIEANLLLKNSIVYLETHFGNSYAKGSIGKNVDIDAKVNLREYLPGQIPFDLSADMKIFGSLDNILATGDILLVSEYFEASTNFSLKNWKISLNEIIMKDEKLSFDGYIDLLGKKIKSKISANVDIKAFLSNASGRCTINLDLFGSLNEPKFYLDLLFQDISYLDFSADSVIANIRGDSSKIYVERFFIDDSSGHVSIDGFYAFNGNYLIKAESEKIDLSNFFLRYLDSIEGSAKFKLSLSNNDWNGNLSLSNFNLKSNLNKFSKYKSSIDFEDANLHVELDKKDIFVKSSGILNHGEYECNFTLKELTDLDLNFKAKEVLISLDGYLNALVNGDINVREMSIYSNIEVLSGNLVDIPSFKSGKSLIKELNLVVRKGFNVALINILGLEKTNIDLEGRIRYSEGVFNGYVTSESGDVIFNKNKFDIDRLNIIFDKNEEYPYLYMIASSYIVDSTVFLSLRGNLGSKEVKIEEDIRPDDKDFFKISLWSDTGLGLNDILYLLSSSSSDAKQNIGLQGGALVSNELAKAFLFNPVSKTIKDFLGIYQFRASSPSIIDGNFLANFEFETIISLYKNLFFFGYDMRLSDTGKEVDLARVSISSFNRWAIKFSHKYRQEQFIDLEISKQGNIGRQRFEIGLAGLQNALSSIDGLRLNLELNLRV